MTYSPPELPTLAAQGAALAGLGLVGLALGSFAVTAGLRASQGQSALRGRSRCDSCGVALSFSDTLPLVSYTRRQGRCGACGVSIDPTHLAGELAGLVVVTSAVLIVGPARGAIAAGLGLILIATSAVDWKTQRLPDAATLAVAILGAILTATTSTAALIEGLVAAALVGGVMWLVRSLSRRRGAEAGLGLGDVKLAAALALWLGAASGWMIALAAILGLAAMALLRPADGKLPFGPWIAAAGFGVGLAREGGLWPMTP